MGGLDGQLTIHGRTEITLSGVGRESEVSMMEGRMVKARVLGMGKDFIALGLLRDLQSHLSHDG
jgi:hypothetical protein